MKESKISYWASYLTTIVSVTMVLVIIGAIALISVTASRETKHLQENVELTAILTDSTTDQEGTRLYRALSQRPWVNHIEYFSKKKVVEMMNAATGEDVEKIAGTDFLSPEITFSLKADYTAPVQMERIIKELEKQPLIEEVGVPDSEMLSSMRSNIDTLMWVLGAIALVMVVISIILINNTVRLTIYSRRFTIHTMRLVGATNGFIRRPFVGDNALAGLIASLIAAGILAIGVEGTRHLDVAGLAMDWGAYFIIAGSLVVLGVAICAVSSSLATTNYLRKKYDDLFK